MYPVFIYDETSIPTLSCGIYFCYCNLNLIKIYVKKSVTDIIKHPVYSDTLIPSNITLAYDIVTELNIVTGHPIRKKTGELPTTLPMGCTWATEWAARGLPMGILPCKLGCPLLPYMETVGSSVVSSVGSPLLPKMKKWAARWAAEWAAHGLPMGICHAN